MRKDEINKLDIALDRVKVQSDIFDEHVSTLRVIADSPRLLDYCDKIAGGFDELHATLSSKRFGDNLPEETIWGDLRQNILRLQHTWEHNVSRHPALASDYQKNVPAQRNTSVEEAMIHMLDRVNHECSQLGFPEPAEERRTPVKSVHVRVPISTYDYFKERGGEAGFASAMADALVAVHNSRGENK